MNTSIELSAGEASEIAPVMEMFSRGGRRPITLGYLYQRWRDFVTEVERGYDATIYDYTNDLSVRDMFEEILGRVGIPRAQKLITALQPWDVRFDQATTEAAQGATGQQVGLRRPLVAQIPLKLQGELEADLRSDGLVE